MADRNKRQRPVSPDADDVLRKAREVWSRDPNKERSTQTEDRDFRDHFGCSVMVFLSLWGLLVTMDIVPSGGTIEHLLWTLLFLKTYAKQKVLCSLAGGVDDETFAKWTWKFIFAISELEVHVVSLL